MQWKSHIHVKFPLFSVLLCVLVFTNTFGAWPFSASHALAAQSTASSAPVTTTVQSFLKGGNSKNSTIQHTFVRPSQIPAVPASAAKSTKSTSQKPLPSAEPAKMKSFAYQLDSSFLLNSPKAAVNVNAAARASKAAIISAATIPGGTSPLSAKGSDGRLEIALPRGSVDLTNATIDGGSAPVGSLSVQVSQNYGHYDAERLFLGSYVIQVVDSQGHVVHGLTLTQPLTIRYHYTKQELQDMGIDPNNVLLSWPNAIAAVQNSKTATKIQNAQTSINALTTKMTNNATTQTLTVQVSMLGLSTMDVSSEAVNQAPPKPNTFSVSGNSGQFAYSYPISVAPGPAGFAPQLQLTYSSESTNERYHNRSAAGSAGEGWSVSMGSISKESYPSSSTSGAGDWYFLSGIDGVSERLVPAIDLGANFYTTQHISHLKIQKVSDTCWYVWGTSGDFNTLGCNDSTTHSLQYTTDSSGNKQIYQWDLDRVLTPSPANNPNQVRQMTIFYLQDSPDGGQTIRDSGIAQIRYGSGVLMNDLMIQQPGDMLSGLVNFFYHAPQSYSIWAQAYGSNYNCASTPDVVQTLRCDDPTTFGGNIPAPRVMSTLTLDGITSYVGDDSSASHKAFSYSLTYNKDIPFSHCWDHVSLVDEYCAGAHTLAQITPTIYQNGVAHVRQGITFQYTGPLVDGYYDPNHTTSDPNQQYGGQTYWYYISSYHDLDTGQGETVSYTTAHNNTNGTPYVINADGSIDDRHDPLYCSIHANDSQTSNRCNSPYWGPDVFAWSRQVVTQVQAIGKDSSSGALTLATTTYNYALAKTGTGCNPLTGSGVPTTPNQTDCVGDNWIPGYNGVNNTMDGDWVDYYHSEFRGFNAVFITSSAGNLTTNYYYSTEGWNTPESDGGNYNSGQMYEQDIYQGNHADSSHLLLQTLNSYTGVAGPFSSTNSCDGKLNPTYNPCIAEMPRTKTIFYEGDGGNANAPWVQTDYTYDDYSPTSGYVFATTYHNLQQEVTTSSNVPTITKKYQYQINDQTLNGWVYYIVNKVSHSEVDDASGHVWACQNNTYDEGSPTGMPVPNVGLLTTTTAYSNCSNTAGTALTSYTGYDKYGNAVAAVDPFGVANSSIYSTKGCTPTTVPTYVSSSWTAGHYTNCTSYDPSHYEAVPVQQQNVYGQTISTAYDTTQGDLPTSATNANGQTTSTNYSYDSNGNAMAQATQPGALNGYSSQSKENSQCTASSTLPCYEIDTNTALYAGAVTRTFYDTMGRAVETRTPLDATHDTIVFTVHDDAHNSVFQSVPFRVPSGTNWIDPNVARDETNAAPGGTATFSDALGRTIAVLQPIGGSLTCGSLAGTYNTCITYGLGSPHGHSTLYHYARTLDANNHMTASFVDALGRERFSQEYSVAGSIGSNVTVKHETQYNVLGKPTTVIVTDLAPQSGQTITSVTSSATYDDMGRPTSSTDPDRGTHTFSYDSGGRLIKDVSGSRTLGISYDLVGRVGCEQDAAPTTDGSGTCSSGSHPLIQNTYDVSKLGTSGTTDFPIGQLTQSVATTYYPDGTSSTATEQAQHDQRGRAVMATLQIAVPSSWGLTSALPTYQETQRYNDANQPMTVQTKSGDNVDYTFSQAYDSATGTLTGLSNNSIGVANLASQQFDLHGQVSDLNFQTTTGTALANEHFTYDGDLRPTSTTATWQSGSGSTGTIFSNSRTYDPVSNVSSVSTTHAAVSGQSNSGGSTTQNFCYDEENRLIWAGNQGTQPSAGMGTCGSGTLSNTLNGGSYSGSYAYTHLGQQWQGSIDGNGQQQQYLYCDSSHPHQLTGLYPIGTTCATTGTTTANYSLSYDNWGNVTSRTYAGTAATLSYDVLDHLVQWSGKNTTNQQSTGQQWYVYDASGQRVLQRSTIQYNTPLIVYAFGSDEHDYTATGQGGDSLYYYSLGGRLIGVLYSSETDVLLTDAEGSVLSRMTTLPDSAAVKGNQVYSPYGSKLYSSGSMATNRGFTGQYKDATGLNYYNARYYDSVAGRFISADTVQGNGQGMDPYAYVGGNPETLTDPTGHCGLLIGLCIIIGGAIIGAVAGAVGAVVVDTIANKGHVTFNPRHILAGAVVGGIAGAAIAAVGLWAGPSTLLGSAFTMTPTATTSWLSAIGWTALAGSITGVVTGAIQGAYNWIADTWFGPEIDQQSYNRGLQDGRATQSALDHDKATTDAKPTPTPTNGNMNTQARPQAETGANAKLSHDTQTMLATPQYVHAAPSRRLFWLNYTSSSDVYAASSQTVSNVTYTPPVYTPDEQASANRVTNRLMNLNM